MHSQVVGPLVVFLAICTTAQDTNESLDVADAELINEAPIIDNGNSQRPKRLLGLLLGGLLHGGQHYGGYGGYG